MGINDFSNLKLTQKTTVTASAAQLESIRLRKNFQLPKSYCHFAEKFGYGLLCKLYIIYIPMKGEDSLEKRNVILTNTLMNALKNDLFDFAPDGSQELIERLVPFGISENGDILAWDSNERSSDDEYAIYMIAPRCAGVAKSATSLYDFVEKCFDNQERGLLPRSVDEVKPIFEPLELYVE